MPGPESSKMENCGAAVRVPTAVVLLAGAAAGEEPRLVLSLFSLVVPNRSGLETFFGIGFSQPIKISIKYVFPRIKCLIKGSIYK